jgi:hypothetical protein
MRFGGYSEEDARKIHRKVLGREEAQKPLDMARNLTVQNNLYYMILLDNLDAATDPYTGFTQAQGQIIRYIQPVNPHLLDMEDSTSVSAEETVTNRYTSFSAAAGDLLLVIRNGSEWSPITAVASPQKHAEITGCAGNGYYVARLATAPTFSYPETGTGTGTVGACDLCESITGEATGTDSSVARTCGSLTQPTRTQVNGTGESIYCYDPRKLTLNVGAHVIVSNLGDTIVDPEPGTGTGTGTASDMVTLWMILTGNYELVAIPDRFYKCCDDQVILARCDNYIVEGVYCPGDEIDCPTTGTGL